MLAPTWTKRAPRKSIQFTWKRNDSNHEFHLDTETVDNQLVSSKYSYYKSNNKKINHQPTDWWLLTNPLLWWLMDIFWLWCNHNNVMQLLSQAGAAYSSGTAMVVPVFLLNNRYQFWCPFKTDPFKTDHVHNRPIHNRPVHNRLHS